MCGRSCARSNRPTVPTKRDLTLCHNCPLTLWPARKKEKKKPKTAKDSLKQPHPSFATLNPDPPPHCIHPPSSPTPTSLLTPAACIKDPSEVSLATFTSERGPIMERLGRRMRRQRGTHGCGGAWGGGMGGGRSNALLFSTTLSGGEEEGRAG